MRHMQVLVCAPFRFDLGAERLWRDTAVVRLTAKAFAVLRYLVLHADHLVTKDELIEAVWALPVVSDAALTVCIGEIRRALGDTARAPQFLETVRGRGYRFCSPVTVAPGGSAAGSSGQQAWKVLRTMQDADNFKGLGRWVIDNEVGIHRPEEHGLIGEILASMAKSRILS